MSFIVSRKCEAIITMSTHGSTLAPTLNWYRSWPERVPEHLQDRPRVIDNQPLLLMRNWDYYTCPFPDEDLCMLEWDIALDRFSRERFVAEALKDREMVMTAPYRLSDGRMLYNGFGCVYLPRKVVTEFIKERPNELFSDSTFFRWYGTPKICPNVYPQHLNT